MSSFVKTADLTEYPRGAFKYSNIVFDIGGLGVKKIENNCFILQKIRKHTMLMKICLQSNKSLSDDRNLNHFHQDTICFS